MNVLEYFKKISTFIFDIDGVLTDGTLLVMPNGLLARKMHIKDGFAIQMALDKGYNVIVISGGFAEPVLERLHKLGVAEVHMSIANKKDFLNNYIKDHKLKNEEVLYMADDLPDIEAMKIVGLACCPLDAVSEVKEIVKYISPVNGGMGCVRDVIEKVLKSKGEWHYSE